MGTSISQSSPRKSSNWKRVLVCYEDNKLPDSRVVNEIWRAAETTEKGQLPISVEMKSANIYACYQAVSEASTFQEAIQSFNRTLAENKSNSILAEFARRVIPASFQSDNPPSHWTTNFFKEVTAYIVSRDASGYVGDSYRNKSVQELIAFKQVIAQRIDQTVGSGANEARSVNEWERLVDQTIAKLKNAR